MSKKKSQKVRHSYIKKKLRKHKTKKYKKSKRGGTRTSRGAKVSAMDMDVRNNWNLRSWFNPTKEEKEEKRREKKHEQRKRQLEDMEAKLAKRGF